MFSSHHPEYWVEALERDYQKFLTLVQAYDSDPNDFLIVYDFLNTHPAFWIRSATKRNKSRKDFVHWDTNDGIASFNVFPLRDEENPKEYEWFVEGGAHVEHDDLNKPAYSTHYTDPRLYSRGKTYEDALIAFAKKVRELLPLDGSPSNT